jgi:hypothetical protein
MPLVAAVASARRLTACSTCILADFVPVLLIVVFMLHSIVVFRHKPEQARALTLKATQVGNLVDGCPW